MSQLGWRLLKEGEFLVTKLPQLSGDEEKLLLAVRKEFHEKAKEAGETGGKLRELILQVAADNRLQIWDDQLEYLAEAAQLDAGCGVLDLLLDEPQLEEIAVIGVDKPIFVYHRQRGWLKTNAMITDAEYLIHLVNKMARSLGRRVTWQSPRLNATLPNGARLHASIPPISGGEITIRKFRENPIHVGELVSGRTFSAEALAWLWILLQGDLSTMIAGNTGSGKTSTLNALLAFLPLSERLLVTEETPELNVPHQHKVKMLANEETGNGMGELVADALRMRPDRVIVGEVRTANEAKALFESILAGQARGAFATFHAGSGREALARLKGLGVAEMDWESLDLVVVQRRILRWGSEGSSEIRRCVEISEVQGQEVVPIFVYDVEKDEMLRTDEKSKVEEEMRISMRLSESEWKARLKERTEFLVKLASQKVSFEEALGRIQERAVRR